VTKRKPYGKAPRATVKAAGLWEEDCAALLSLFRSLPIRRGKTTDAIPYEWLIGDIPHQLLLMRPVPPDKRPKIAGTKRALQRLAQTADRTAKVLEDLPSNARAALIFRPDVLQHLTTMLRVLAVDASADKDVTPGRPEKIRPSQAEKVADAVAQHYHGLTGKKPTAHDQTFVRLLGDVFVILGIDASASAQATAWTARKTRQK
jgi:hypothetical protein